MWSFSGEKLLNELLLLINENMIPDIKVKEFKNKTYICQNNSEGVTYFKQILNYFIDYNYREMVVDELCKKFHYSLKPDSFYMNQENLKELFNHGHIIGSHTVDHPVMSKLSKNKQKLQLKDSFAELASYNIIKDKVYCHPYGGFHSFNKDTQESLKEEKVLYSFNVEDREILPSDYKKSMQFLPRFDCNLFRYGNVS